MKATANQNSSDDHEGSQRIQQQSDDTGNEQAGSSVDGVQFIPGTQSRFPLSNSSNLFSDSPVQFSRSGASLLLQTESHIVACIEDDQQSEIDRDDRYKLQR